MQIQIVAFSFQTDESGTCSQMASSCKCPHYVHFYATELEMLPVKSVLRLNPLLPFGYLKLVILILPRLNTHSDEERNFSWSLN